MFCPGFLRFLTVDSYFSYIMHTRSIRVYNVVRIDQNTPKWYADVRVTMYSVQPYIGIENGAFFERLGISGYTFRS